MKKRNPGRRLLSLFLTVVLTVAMLPAIGTCRAEEVNAASVYLKHIAGLGTSMMKAPTAGTQSAGWTGSYVWYGKYNGEPVKYRVLAPVTTAFNRFGTRTLFLDCDSVLYKAPFDADGSANSSSAKPNTWSVSDILEGLNGNTFFRKAGNFTTPEKDAILPSIADSHALVQGTAPGNVSSWTRGIFKDYVALFGEKIFLLDAEEASNSLYGYNYSDAAMTGRIKEYQGDTVNWWLRSASSNSATSTASVRSYDGAISSDQVNSTSVGVSPALNISLSSILFSSVVSGTVGEDNTEYKLTIIDQDLSAELPEHTSVTYSHGVYYFPYSVTGADAKSVNRLSTFVLDKEYTPGNTNDAKVLYYEMVEGNVGENTPIPTTGKTRSALPLGTDVKDWGKSYHVYMVAEIVNELHETDYASEPVELPAPKSAAGVSTSMIIGPVVVANNEHSWQGSYVWYGKYNGKPVRYRVLAPKTDKYGGSTMLLDSDYILYTAPFDSDGKPNTGAAKPNQWLQSDIRAGLNGSAFLNKANGFTQMEKNAITESKSSAHNLIVGTGPGHVSSWTKGTFGKYVGLTGEKIFLLDSEDVSNAIYGYHYDQDLVLSRLKIRLPYYEGDDTLSPWWLRSAYSDYETNAGYVYTESAIEYTDVKDTGIGVSPAFNVDRSLVVLSSLVSGKQGFPGAEYKLTLQNNNISLAMQPGEMILLSGYEDHLNISVPYKLSGTDASKVTTISVMILDKEYKPGNTNNANILFYEDALTPDEEIIPETGYAGFVLPKGLSLSDMNKTYFAYLIAEDINGIHETDYASEPVKISGFGQIAPQIVTQPKTVYAPVGSTATFSVKATGKAPLTYQWQSRRNFNSAWTNSGQTGAKTATLKVENISAGLHGWQFRCVVTDADGASTASNYATLKVVPKITQQPKNATVPVSDTVQFTVAATGKGPLKYQWQSRKNSSTAWSNSGLPGAKTATLSFPATTGLHGWQFRCVVTDANGMSWGSNAATLKVVPKITKQPKSTSVKAGSVATFTVAANGKGPLKYQWQSRKNASSSWSNSGQSGAKTATLNVNALAGLNGWQFRCVVTDANGMSWGSNPATLTVTK